MDSRFLLEVPRGTYRLHQDFFLDSRVSRSALFSKKKDPRGGAEKSPLGLWRGSLKNGEMPNQEPPPDLGKGFLV